MEFRILGPLEVRERNRALPLGGRRQRALLAYLLLHANEAVSSDRLIDELWGSAPPETVQTMLQVYVSRLRKVLEPGRARGASDRMLVTQPPGYLLRLEPDQLDLRRFERMVAEAGEALGDGRAAEAAQALREALSPT
jgi:DNA-binding SARP family transcriptional activator